MSKKNILLAIMTTAMCSFTFSSCSNDDDNDNIDNNETETITPETPAYEDVSAKYIVQSNSADISSIELTAGGNYIIVYGNMPYYSAQEAKAISQKRSLQCVLSKSERTSRATALRHISGKFTKISDTEFVLEGFGTIVIEGAANNAYSIQVTEQDGETYPLSAEKAVSMINDSEKTNALCRTWNLETIRMTVTFNNVKIFDETKPAAEYSQLMEDLYAAMKRFAAEHGDEDEDEDDEEDFEIPTYGYAQIIFTKAGTYMVTSTDGQLGISMWKWLNEQNGTIRYTHDYNDTDFSSYWANNATISFNGSTMTLAETNLMYEEDDESIQMKSWYTCTEAQ